MTLAELYQSRKDNEGNIDLSCDLLGQTHWFSVNAEFDPKTGDALPQALSAFLAKVAHPKQDGPIQDRLHRITEHARSSVKRLLRSLNESPRREQALLPVHAVRELDANSFIKLSNRPGRNIREKLAGKPYLQAVRRYQSVNLPENQLLKAFVNRLAELLELRRDILGEAEDDLLPRIHSWRRGDEAQAIARWENLPPNNTLLAHRDYRRVWDSWRHLQTLDEDIARDLSHLDERQRTMTKWMDYGRTYREGKHLFAEMPVLFHYETFSINAWHEEPLFKKTGRKLDRSYDCRTYAEPVCVDLSEMIPRFAIGKSNTQELKDAYLWQQWKRDSERVNLSLFHSDAAFLHPDAVTITSSDLFFEQEKDQDLLDLAAQAFALGLKKTFKDDKLIWLVPDALNDFELKITRQNLNARFSGAQPLPRSIAAVFDQVDYTRITRDGYGVLVVDTLGGSTCATKMIARLDADLKKRLPETNGYYWERSPPVMFSERDTEKERLYDMVTVGANGEWRNSAAPKGILDADRSDADRLKADPRIEGFAYCINLSDSPVAGGMRLHAMQERAGDIPLWRDQIPELSIKVMKEGRYQRFDLVTRGTTVKPIRGRETPIEISEHFTLRTGKRKYQFPLYQGENEAELRFSARLDSPAFPLKTNKECKLNLSFQYGEDEPYKLVFSPLDKSFPPVRATFQRTVEEIVTDAPAPVYPEPRSWDDLQKMPKPDSEETSDLLEWFVSAVDRLHRELQPKRTVGSLTTEWLVDRNGNNYSFAECGETNERVLIHQNNFVKGVDYLYFHEGDQLSFEVQERNGKFSGGKVAPPHYVAAPPALHLIRSIRKRLYFPVIQVWRDGRSITGGDCPKPFAKNAKNKISSIASLLKQKNIPKNVEHELLFLLACLHKDTTEECVRWVSDQVKTGRIRDPRAIGFALGDVSQEWQQDIFNTLASKPNNSVISVFAYAIWRERNFVNRFSLKELKALLNSLSKRLGKIRHFRINKNKKNDIWAKRDWARATAEPLELLLGLLRTRDSEDPEIKMLLQPHQKITKQLAVQIDQVEEIVAESKITLFSRVQVDVQKPKGIRTPDLLYALRLYLTGDDGADAIHITGVSDGEDDK
jgi:hypothetical protein